MHRALRPPELLFQLRERRGIAVVAVDVAKPWRERGERALVQAAVLGDARFRALEQLRQSPPGLGHADNRKIELAATRHRLERRKDLLVREVPRGAEEHKGIGTRFVVSFHGVVRLAPPRPTGSIPPGLGPRDLLRASFAAAVGGDLQYDQP